MIVVACDVEAIDMGLGIMMTEVADTFNCHLAGEWLLCVELSWPRGCRWRTDTCEVDRHIDMSLFIVKGASISRLTIVSWCSFASSCIPLQVVVDST